MSYCQISSVCIGGVAVAVPQNTEDNRVKAKTLGVDDIERFIDTVGVEKRHVAVNGQTSSDLCYVAAERLIDSLQINREEIDCVLFVTQTEDYIAPATACVLHGRLGLRKDAMAFDVNLGCSGFVYGLSIASSLITGMKMNKVLLLVGDILRKNEMVDVKDTLLFGDAGTATLVEAGDGVIETSLFTNGKGYTNLIIPGGGTRRPYHDGDNFWQISKPEMDGESVMAFTITEVPKAFKDFFAHNGKAIDEYDLCLLHQANKQMVQYIAKKLKISEEKMPLSMDQYGNTNGSSVLVALADACSQRKMKSKIDIIASGYGIGLSWGVVAFQIETKNVLPIITTDATFEEAYCGTV